jgi:NAD(P)H dehydrogenase (quinone)
VRGAPARGVNGPIDKAGFAPIAERLRGRLAPPRPFPLIPSMQLRPELGDPGAAGFAHHLNGAGAAG